MGSVKAPLASPATSSLSSQPKTVPENSASHHFLSDSASTTLFEREAHSWLGETVCELICSETGQVKYSSYVFRPTTTPSHDTLLSVTPSIRTLASYELVRARSICSAVYPNSLHDCELVRAHSMYMHSYDIYLETKGATKVGIQSFIAMQLHTIAKTTRLISLQPTQIRNMFK